MTTNRSKPNAISYRSITSNCSSTNNPKKRTNSPKNSLTSKMLRISLSPNPYPPKLKNSLNNSGESPKSTEELNRKRTKP